MKKESIENEEFIRVGTTIYKLVNQPRLNGGYVKEHTEWNCKTRHGRKYRILSDYFDEMMKKYIIPLEYRYLYPHQTFIKGVPMMKGEADTQSLFSFRQPFDEKMMNAYHAAIQIVMPCIHRIIVFIAHHKFHGNTAASTFGVTGNRSLPARKARTATVDVAQGIIGIFGATAWEQGQPYLERCSLWMHFIGLTDTPKELLHSLTNPTSGGIVCPRRHSKMSFQLLRLIPVTENPCTAVG